MTARTNDVTLFSNGIGHFRRIYKVPHGKEESFSIPFKRDHIGDVAASLQVFGKVRLTKPPSFTPSNANATSLRIDQCEAYRSLLRNLSGAAVTVELTDGSKGQYTLLGLEQQEQSTGNGDVIATDYVVLMRIGKVHRIGVFSVKDIHFDDESVRTEIDKALKNNFQTIKPDSTLLDLTLSVTGDADQEATVQYTIPVAAWKMRYAIRQDGDNFTLEGAAIIDNNTDEDWDNFSVSVVTGNPISFNTDIATVSVPKRKFVRLVDDDSLGNVDVEEGGGLECCAMSAETVMDPNSFAPRGRSYASKSMMKRSVATSTQNYAQYGLDELPGSTAEDYLEAAQSAGVESKEVGDFCVFTSKEPITILARKSAVVPMFTVPLSKAGVILLYKEANHARRPYRAVKFKNETEFSLGKGKTVIYNSGIFSGECVLETTKPGDNRMLPHCLENGVKIVKESKAIESKTSSIRISEGVGIVENVQTAVTVYTIENKKDEPFKVALEHTNLLSSPNTIVDFDGEVKEREKLVQSNGYRAYLDLSAKQVVKLKVTETLSNSHKTLLASYYPWLRTNIIDVKNPLSKDKQILAAIKVQEQIDEMNVSLNDAKSRRSELTQQGDRVRQNLEAAKDVGNSNTVASWVADLDLTEKEIREIDKKKIPDFNKKLRKLQDELNEELKKITANWKA